MISPAEPWDVFPTEASEVAYASLPVSVFARGERRMEAENYLTGGYGLRVQIESSVPFTRLDALARVWQPDRLKGTLVGPHDGVPFYTATQVFDIRPVPRKWVAPSKTPNLSRRFVERGWMLVTCSGSVGDSIVAFGPHLGIVISHDLLRVQVDDPTHLGYLYAFLRSRFGRTMLRSSKYGSIVKHLEPAHLVDVPIPTVADSFYDDMNERIGRVFDLRERAFELTRDAERLYADRFAPVATDPGDATGFIVSAHQMFATRRRLDAHYHNPRARAVLAALDQARTVPLESVTETLFGVPRFKHVYRGQGIPYVDSEDLFKLNPEITKFIPPVTKTDATRYYVERGWLLMASSGQLYGINGSVIISEPWHEHKIISNHVLRIVPKAIRSGYLAMALGHPELGRPLVLRLAFGSEIPEIPPDALLTLPIARLDSLEDEIADRMEEASAARMRADREEDDAVGRVERDLESRLHGTAEERQRRVEEPPGMENRAPLDMASEEAMSVVFRSQRSSYFDLK